MKNMYGKELKFPEDVHYSEELLWVKKLDGNMIRVGVSDLGVKAVKELVHVNVTAGKNAQVAKGDLLGQIETTKGVWEIIAPLSGTIIEINPPIVQGNAIPIQNDNYGRGWIIEMEMADDSDLNTLRNGSEEETKKWVQEKAEEVVPLMDEEDDDDY